MGLRAAVEDIFGIQASAVEVVLVNEKHCYGGFFFFWLFFLLSH